MRAATVAAKLNAFGVKTGKVTEGDEVQDGMVEIDRRVHVQVPTFGRCLNVVAETGRGTFHFFDPTNNFQQILRDLQKASK